MPVNIKDLTNPYPYGIYETAHGHFACYHPSTREVKEYTEKLKSDWSELSGRDIAINVLSKLCMPANPEEKPKRKPGSPKDISHLLKKLSDDDLSNLAGEFIKNTIDKKYNGNNHLKDLKKKILDGDRWTIQSFRSNQPTKTAAQILREIDKIKNTVITKNKGITTYAFGAIDSASIGIPKIRSARAINHFEKLAEIQENYFVGLIDITKGIHDSITQEIKRGKRLQLLVVFITCLGLVLSSIELLGNKTYNELEKIEKRIDNIQKQNNMRNAVKSHNDAMTIDLLQQILDEIKSQRANREKNTNNTTEKKRS